MEMSEKEQPRSIRFPMSLWKAIDEDAKRCKRSAQKQMEAILSSYYDFGHVELDNAKLEAIRLKQNGVLASSITVTKESKSKKKSG